MKFAMVYLAAVLAAGTCFAQGDEKKPTEEPRYFRLDFVVRELEGGKVISARNYFTTVASQTRENSSIRTGDKVPLPTGSGGNFTYLDVGVNIDSRVMKATDTQLMLAVSADVSSFVAAANSGSSMPPVVRQNRWSANVVVPFKKSTTIFSADGASEKRQMQIDLTATPLL
jgi:hypothetical protein